MNDNYKIGLDDLEKVSGGKAAPEAEIDAAEKLKELKAVINELDLDYSGHRILALADKWAENGYQPSAREFVAQELGLNI